MAPRTRYFLVGSGLVVVIGLCSGLVAYYAGAPGRSARLSELAYVPRTANALAYADVADIIDSPFHQHLRQLMPAGNDRSEFQNETGIDVERDIDSVIAAMHGRTHSGLNGLVLVRGRFDQSKIEATATGHGAVAEAYRNVKLLVAPGDPGEASGRPTIAFLEPGLLAFGARDAVRQGLDAAAEGAGANQDSELMAAVSGVERSGNAWFVARADAMASDASVPDVIRQHIAGVRWLAAGANVDRGVRAMVRADTRDNETAQNLRAVVNGAVAAARLLSSRDARLDAILNSIQTSGSGSTVELEFTLPAEFLELAKETGHWPTVH
jgi:hypothetical protein